jgi:hypothetical protein
LVPLSRHRLELALHRVAPALILLQRHHLIQIGVREALHLALQAGLRAVELRAARLELLRQPLPTPRLLECLRDTLRMRQDLTEILPHQGVELVGRGKACRALLGPTGAQRRHLAVADIVGVARTGAPSRARLTTLPAAHQRPQQVGVHGVVPGGLPLIAGELRLHLGKLLLADYRGDGGHGDPGGGRRLRLGGGAECDGPERRKPPAAGAPRRPTRVDLSRVCRILLSTATSN